VATGQFSLDLVRVFPQAKLSSDTRKSPIRRKRSFDQTFQRASKSLVECTVISNPAIPQNIRRVRANRLLRVGCDMRPVQEPLSRSEVDTAMIYTHVLKFVGVVVCRPVDAMRLTRNSSSL